MRALTVQVLGSPVLEWDGQTVAVPARKSLLLLCLLALRNAPVSREEAAQLLWNGRLSSVRQALYQLRRLPGAEQWLQADDQLQLNAVTDVAEFERNLDDGNSEAALQLWRGPLLEGIDFDDAAELQRQFDEEAVRLEQLLRLALGSRARELETQGELRRALAKVQRLLQLDPLDEVSVRSAMRLELLLDRPVAALSRYRSWTEQLKDEVGAEPREDTVQLAQAIERGELPDGV